MAGDEPKLIVFYDGLCGFCDRTVRYILDRDANDRFRFAPLQSDLALKVLPPHGKDPKNLHSLYVLEREGQEGETVLEKSSAAIRIARELGPANRIWATLLGILPRPVRDWFYDRVAKSRYRIFGKLDACRIPAPDQRSKFIGL